MSPEQSFRNLILGKSKKGQKITFKLDATKEFAGAPNSKLS